MRFAIIARQKDYGTAFAVDAAMADVIVGSLILVENRTGNDESPWIVIASGISALEIVALVNNFRSYR